MNTQQTKRTACPQQPLFRRGLSIVEVLVVVGVIALVLALALVTLGRSRDAARSTSCTDNLGLLAKSAHEYANDHDGRFFYHWHKKNIKPDGSTGYAAGWWYDTDRLGRYQPEIERERLNTFHWDPDNPGEPISERRAASPAHDHYCRDLGLRELINGPMVCPTQSGGVKRSYAMNYWASGVDRTTHAVRSLSHATFSPKHGAGAFFDRSSEYQDKLILFTEAWVSPLTLRPDREDAFGIVTPPSYRFGGQRHADGKVLQTVIDGPPLWLPDYGRRQHLGKDSVNFALSDGHVARFSMDDLYNREMRKSTYRLLWSEIDEDIDAEFLQNDPTQNGLITF